MGKWGDVDERRVWRALVVQEADSVEADALDYLAHTSRADPTEVA